MGGGVDGPLSNVIGVSIQDLVGLTVLQADAIGLFDGAIALGWTLLTPLFAIRAWRAAASGRGSEVVSLLVRAAVIGMLLTSMTSIRIAAVSIWAGAYDWASAGATRLMNLDGENMAELREHINGMAGGSDVAAGLAAVLAFSSDDVFDALVANPDQVAGVVVPGATGVGAGLRRFASVGASAVGPTASAARFAFRWVTRGIRFVLVPIMLFFLIMIYISALTVILAVIVLPVALPLLLTPVGGGLVAGVVTRAAAAFGAVIALPMIFAVAMNLGVILPISRIVNDVSTVVDAVREAGLGRDAELASRSFWSILFDWGRNAEMNLEALGTYLSAFTGILDAMFFGILGLIVGIFAAFAIAGILNQIFERLLGTIMVSGRAPSAPRLPPSGSKASVKKDDDIKTGGGGGEDGGPKVRPDIGGSSGSGSTTPLNPPVTQPSAYASRQTQSLNRPVSPDATPDAEV